MAQNSLDPQLAETLAQLRQQPQFHRLLQAYRRTTLPTFRPSRGKGVEDWIYASGKSDGERDLIAWLLGGTKLEVND